LYTVFDLHSNNSYLGIISHSSWRDNKKRGPQMPVLFFALLPLHALVQTMTLVAERALESGELRYVLVIVGF